MSITQRLFVAIFGLTTVVLVVTLGVARWSFERGLLDYVTALEQERLTHLAVGLEVGYGEAGGEWTPEVRRGMERRLREWRRPDADRPPRIGARAPDARAGTLADEPGERPGGRRRGPRGGRRRRGAPAPPTALFDVDGEWLAGSMEFDREGLDHGLWIESRGARIGELRSRPRRIFERAQEAEFSRAQWRASLLTGAFALFAAAALSWALAVAIVAPLRRVTRGVRALSDGDYAVRLEEDRADELGALIEDVNLLARTLELSQESRRRGLADVSHELRTPLTILVGELQAIRDGVRAFDAEQLGSFEAEVDRMRRLVDDLYQMSVTDLGGLGYEWVRVDVGEVLEGTLEVMSTRAGEEVFSLERERGLEVRGDAIRLEQLFVNLARNSVAYTDEPGARRVVAYSERDEVCVVFEDGPPGVAEEHCEQLFEPLFRTDASRTRRTGGAGLGLAICRNIVEAHGGRISASPSGLGGLRVAIRLPMRGRGEP